MRIHQLILPMILTAFCWSPSKAAELKFDFNPAKTQPGYTQVTPGTAYDAPRGFGFLGEPPAAPNAARVFAVKADEGNYQVTMRFGDPARATSTTVKAEARRLMIERVETQPGKYETRTFTVNVRKQAISTGGNVKLKSGENAIATWDDQLSFEFNGKQPGVASMEIKPAAANVTTVFIAGDSTVTDQSNEPWGGWGQMLPRFFQADVAVSNHARSGLTLSSFSGQNRLDKVLSMMKKGDYLFIQFGHNDQKDKGAGDGPGRLAAYKANLKKFVAAARNKGGIPVLVSPMERRRWENDKLGATLADYAEVVRQVAGDEKAPFIDLNAMSLKLYAAFGPEKSKQLFVFYPANTYPGQDKELKDNTHHNIFGGYELARCVVEGIKANVPDLAKHLAKDVGTFDPSKPDVPEKVVIPPSPVKDAIEKPEGS